MISLRNKENSSKFHEQFFKTPTQLYVLRMFYDTFSVQYLSRKNNLINCLLNATSVKTIEPVCSRDL